MEDLRLNEISFGINNQVECEEVFRELCSHHKIGIGKAKAFCKAQSIIKDTQVYLLCKYLNLRIEIDFLKDKFIIFYPEKENQIISFPGQEELKPEPNADGTTEGETEGLPAGTTEPANSGGTGSADDDDPDLF